MYISKMKNVVEMQKERIFKKAFLPLFYKINQFLSKKVPLIFLFFGLHPFT